MGFAVSVKVQVARAICHPAIGRLSSWALRNRIPIRGCIIDTRSPLITAEIKALLFWGLYESAEIRFVNQYLRRDLDVIELGGSLGLVTCQIRKRLAAFRRVVCVEANPQLVSQLKLNLKLNNLEQNVYVVNKAIDYDPSLRSTVCFSPGSNNVAGKIARQHVGDGELTVTTTTLEQIIAENEIDEYTLVADIEGAEAGLALEEVEALKGCRQAIIELHDTTYDGTAVTVEQIYETMIKLHGFNLRDRYGPVCVFEK
jgi:FkbM family methyltransferase